MIVQIRRWTSIWLIAVIFLTQTLRIEAIQGDIEAASAESDETLRNAIGEAAVLIQEILEYQHKLAIQEAKKDCIEKGYDYALTMENYMEESSGFPDADYVGLIAALITLKHISRDDQIRVWEIPFLHYSIKEETIQEARPYKIKEYIEIEEGSGLYKENGYRYSTKKETVPRYAPSDKKGLYIIAGEMMIIPETETVRYGDIRISVITAEELAVVYGIPWEEAKDEWLARRLLIVGALTNEEIRSSVTITFPENRLGQPDWEQRFTEMLKGLLSARITDEGEYICAAADSLIGEVPYMWGGKPRMAGYDTLWWTYDEEEGLQRGLDCSGFVQWAYMTAGYPKELTDKLISTGTITGSDFLEVYEGDLQLGDVGFVDNGLTNHCGIYAGDGEWYHCSSTAGTVIKAPYHFTEFYRPLFSAPLIDNDALLIYYINKIDAQNIKNDYIANFEDVELLARLIEREAGNEGVNGWVAVGEVVINRVESERFPNTVKDVIYQEGNGVKQFAGAKGLEGIAPRRKIRDVAREILNGRIRLFNDPNVLFYKNPTITDGISPEEQIDWGEYKYYTYVGRHSFYTLDTPEEPVDTDSQG